MNRTELGKWLQDWLHHNSELALLKVGGEIMAYDGEDTVFSISRLADDLVRALTEASAAEGAGQVAASPTPIGRGGAGP
jgi:hypothetical protein